MLSKSVTSERSVLSKGEPSCTKSYLVVCRQSKNDREKVIGKKGNCEKGIVYFVGVEILKDDKTIDR